MKLRVFGSGSKGNCLAVRGGGKLLLVDCGLSCRELTKRMAACGLSPDAVDGVLPDVAGIQYYEVGLLVGLDLGVAGV